MKFWSTGYQRLSNFLLPLVALLFWGFIPFASMSSGMLSTVPSAGDAPPPRVPRAFGLQSSPSPPPPPRVPRALGSHSPSKPFPYKRCVDSELNEAVLSVDGKPFIGSLQRDTVHDFRMRFNLLTGRFGVFEGRLHIWVAIKLTEKPINFGINNEHRDNFLEIVLVFRPRGISPGSVVGNYYDDPANTIKLPDELLQGVQRHFLFCMGFEITKAFYRSPETLLACYEPLPEKMRPWDLFRNQLAGYQDTIQGLLDAENEATFVKHVRICFKPKRRFDMFKNDGFPQFVRAVNEKTLPLGQYVGEDDQIDMNPESALMIHEVHKRMMKIDPGKKGTDITYYVYPPKNFFLSRREGERAFKIASLRQFQNAYTKLRGLVDGVHDATLEPFGELVPARRARTRVLKATRIEVDDAKVKKVLEEHFKAYIRKAPHSDGSKDTNPMDGQEIFVDFEIPTIGSPHGILASRSEVDMWPGNVLAMTRAELARRGGADFCILIQRPKGVTRNPPMMENVKVYFKPKMEQASLTLETNAIDAVFCHDDVPHLLALQEMLINPHCSFSLKGFPKLNLYGGPSSNIRRTAKINTIENRRQMAQNIENVIQTLRAQDILNESQVKVLRAVQRLRNKKALCRGPPGTGKTMVLAFMALLLVLAQHKVLVVATTNNSVDDNTNKIVDLIELFQTWFPDFKPRILRVETQTERIRTEENDPTKGQGFESKEKVRDIKIDLAR